MSSALGPCPPALSCEYWKAVLARSTSIGNSFTPSNSLWQSRWKLVREDIRRRNCMQCTIKLLLCEIYFFLTWCTMSWTCLLSRSSSLTSTSDLMAANLLRASDLHLSTSLERIGYQEKHYWPGKGQSLECQEMLCWPVLIVACLHPVEGLLQGLVGMVLIIQLLHLETVGQILKLDICILLNGQLGIRYGLFVIMKEPSFASELLPLSDMFQGRLILAWFSSALWFQTSPSVDDILQIHKRLHLQFFEVLLLQFYKIPHQALKNFIYYFFEIFVLPLQTLTRSKYPIRTLLVWSTSPWYMFSVMCNSSSFFIWESLQRIALDRLLSCSCSPPFCASPSSAQLSRDLPCLGSAFSLLYLITTSVLVDWIIFATSTLGLPWWRKVKTSCDQNWYYLNICSIDPDQLISSLKCSILCCWSVVKHMLNKINNENKSVSLFTWTK